jgi:hypothetical protein
MGTRLIAGAILTILGFITIAICYLGSNNPKQPKWTSEMFMGSFIIPLAIAGMVMGPMLLVEAFWLNRASLTSYDITVALSILVAGVVILLMMRIPKRVAAYNAQQNLADLEKTGKERKSMAKSGASGNPAGQRA